ncbi:hypothetical protein DL766_008489 [Monosporascus sp. MC13-8B]|nr:hypothetical protein DL763_004745 [Monosporascus cannonballus]RYP19281.1 hypothetical protein DL766_008489 [Monosporascus sp. MC13-8B]
MATVRCQGAAPFPGPSDPPVWLHVVPYYIGGGIGIRTPFTGYGSENIISAKLVSVNGELMEVSESRNPEVLWGLRGAGHNDDGQRVCGTYIFLPQQVDAVCGAFEAVMSNKGYVSAGNFMIAFCSPEEAAELF